MGDSVDNVPGVPGVGPKTAALLIQQYGDVEGVLAAAARDDFKKGKLRDNLREHAEAARMSRELVKLKCDVPLEHPLEELELKVIPEAPLRAFLDHHGFRTLLTKLEQVADAPVAEPTAPVSDDPPCDHDGYETVIDLGVLDRWIDDARAQGFRRDRHRNQRHRRPHGASWSASRCAWPPTAPATSRSVTRPPTCSARRRRRSTASPAWRS